MSVWGTFRCALVTMLLTSGIWAADAAKLMERKFKRLPDKKLLSERVYHEVPSNSLIRCAQICSTDADCLSLSWQQGGGMPCLLSSDDVSSDGGALKYLEESPGWITLAVVRYPVFNVVRNVHIHNVVRARTNYNMTTAAEADAECRERGSRLAAPSDLLLARSLGFEYCSCAWLNDNTNGFILQQASLPCWGSYNDQIIVCGFNRANAWCRQTYLNF